MKTPRFFVRLNTENKEEPKGGKAFEYCEMQAKDGRLYEVSEQKLKQGRATARSWALESSKIAVFFSTG